MKKGVRYLLAMFLCIFLLAMAGCNQGAKTSESSTPAVKAKSVALTISAAASLTEVMGEIKKLYTIENPNITINYNFGASGALQQQIEQGASADLFFSAATKQMTALQKKGLILDDTKVDLLGNTVVLVVNNDSKLAISDFKDLTSDKIKKVAIKNVNP